MDTIVKECEADCSIIMAHPNANGFKGAKGPAGGIPDAYTLLARKFYEQIKAQGQENRISLLEYERNSWTYHAKGLWYSTAGSSLPCMTVVGSSNYGERSVNRDLESQICLVTVNKSLQKSLKLEYDHLTHHASTAETELVARFVPKWVRTVVFLFKNFF
jgi:CDP-diacylglycerol--glycerol-3-phosphate 3-phosphatidyltransferase